MVPTASLALPVLLSAMADFVASSLIYVVLGWHEHDLRRLGDGESVMAALRP